MPVPRPDPVYLAAWCALAIGTHLIGEVPLRRLTGDLYPVGLVGIVLIGAITSLRRPLPPPPPPRKPRSPRTERAPALPPLSRFTSRTPWVAPSVWTRRPTDDEYDLSVAAWAVPPAVQAAAPTIQLSPSELRLDEVDLDRAQALLDHTPLVGTWWAGGRWPWCCRRLSVLVAAPPRPNELARWEGLAGNLDQCLTGDPAVTPEALRAWAAELATIRGGGMPTQGVNLFTCSACGRVYGVATHA